MSTPPCLCIMAQFLMTQLHIDFFPKDHASFIMQDGCCSLNQQLFILLFTPYYTDERTQALFAAHYSNPSLKTEFSVASWAFL